VIFVGLVLLPEADGREKRIKEKREKTKNKKKKKKKKKKREKKGKRKMKKKRRRKNRGVRLWVMYRDRSTSGKLLHYTSTWRLFQMRDVLHLHLPWGPGEVDDECRKKKKRTNKKGQKRIGARAVIILLAAH